MWLVSFYPSQSMRGHIGRLIAQGEHQTLDFKYALNDARKISRSLVAFANTDGGRLLVGVKDNGKVAGVDSEEEIFMVEAAAQVYSTPEIAVRAVSHRVDEQTVLEVIVDPSEEKHFTKEEDGRNIAYIRKDDMNLKANPVLLRIWRLEKSKKTGRFRYGQKEIALFEYLREHGSIGFKKYCRITKQHYRKATEKLADLVRWGVLDMEIDEQGTRYLIGEDYDKAMESAEMDSVSGQGR